MAQEGELLVGSGSFRSAGPIGLTMPVSRDPRGPDRSLLWMAYDSHATWAAVTLNAAQAFGWTTTVTTREYADASERPVYLVDQFAAEAVADGWERDNLHRSALANAARQPAFQRLVKLGGSAISLALKRLGGSQRPLWLLFLSVTTTDRPAAGAETVEDAAEAWRRWGRRHRYI